VNIDTVRALYNQDPSLFGAGPIPGSDPDELMNAEITERLCGVLASQQGVVGLGNIGL
jgi:hypothetical protein